MSGKTPKEIRRIVLRAINLEAIEQSLDDEGSKVEALITPDQQVRIRRSNPLQEFDIDITVNGSRVMT